MLPTEKEKLKNILHEVMILGHTTLTTNQAILDALNDCDICKLNEIVCVAKKERYLKIDKIDNLIVEVFARYTPEARDLRQLVAFLKITNEFDRIANSCYSFIRDFPKSISGEVDKDFILEYAIPLQKSSVTALSHALKLLEVDEKQAVHEHYKKVVVEEGKNDELYVIIEKSLLNKINDDVHLTRAYQDIMAALRRLEKIADRALSIANLLHYAKIGGEIGNL